MTRTIASDFVSLAQGATVELFFAVELYLDSGTLRVWTGLGTKTIDGSVYTGTGSLLSVDGFNEASDLGAKGATITMAGMDSSIVSMVLGEPYQGRKAVIRLGITGASATTILFSGYIDTMTIQDSGETSTVAIAVESRLNRLDRPNPFRYTGPQQKDRSAGDTFFDYVARLQDKSINWGKETQGSKVG